MRNSTAKSLILSILLIILFIFALFILGYNLLPMNKIIPVQMTEYKSDELVINEIGRNNTSHDILKGQNKVYEITDADLNLYKSSNTFDPGKADPFAPAKANNVENNKVNNQVTTQTTNQTANTTVSKSVSTIQTNSQTKTTNSAIAKTTSENKVTQIEKKTDKDTTDNFYKASNINKSSK